MSSLRRTLGLGYATLFGVGLILGSGNFVLVGRATGLVGDAGWMSAAFAGAIALSVALSYAELASMFPSDSGTYRYVREAFPRLRILAFLAGWFLFFGAVAGAATDALGFSNHFMQLLGGSDSVVPAALVLLFLLTLLNWWGIRETALLTSALTIAALFGFAFIALAGFLTPSRSPDYTSFNPAVKPLSAVLAGSAMLYFACSGFELQPALSDETRDVERVMPKAIMLSVAIVSLLTITVSFSLVRLARWEELGASKAPVVEAVTRVAPHAAQPLILVALCSTASSSLGYLVAASRLLYGFAMEEVIWRRLCYVSKRRSTPYLGVALSGLLAALIVVFNELGPALMGWRPGVNGFEYQLIDLVGKTASLAMLLASLLVNAALIALRLRAPHLRRSFKVPLSVGPLPLPPIVSSALVAVFITIGFGDWILWLSTAAVTGLGLLLYRRA